MTSPGAKKTITLTFAAIALTTLVVSLLSSRNIELFSPKILLQGPFEAVIPSPDGLMTAVVMEGWLLVVDGYGGYLHEVAPVSTFAPDTKPIGEEYFRPIKI